MTINVIHIQGNYQHYLLYPIKNKIYSLKDILKNKIKQVKKIKLGELMDTLKNPHNINSLIALIELAEKYKTGRKRPRKNEEYIKFNKDMDKLVYALPSLRKLQNLIGMDQIKNNIIDQILFYVQDLNTNEMMHICLSGPPGIGKTSLGKILAELYCSLGFLSTSRFKVVGRTELIAGYVGQTALKTFKVLNESKGGVLFLDEAYSLGYYEGDGNSYAKECIDTINKFLSENTTDFIMIIAGYKEELNKHFFSANKGLERRFPWTYELKDYSLDDIAKIFIYQVEENDWFLDDFLTDFTNLSNIFKKNDFEFKNNGGDSLLIFEKAKICHSRRVFGLPKKDKKVINEDDITDAIKILKQNVKHSTDKFKDPPPMMYI